MKKLKIPIVEKMLTRVIKKEPILSFIKIEMIMDKQKFNLLLSNN